MRVERIRVEAFGRLRGLDTGEEALPPLVVVHGPNEAGKTTFFHLLTSILYGFYPASRDTHPYAPWDGTDIAAEAVLRLAGGERLDVRRRLMSSPGGRLVTDAGEEDLRNRTLPCAEHVPRQVFTQVYALTLAELARLGGESWAAVQDRMVSAMGASDLRPAREVAAELEREAGELWRPHRRGRQRVREMKERLAELRRRREAALERDGRLRETVAEARDASRELREAREERAACRTYVERYRSLLPIRAQLARIVALEEEAGDPADLEGLPPDPSSELDALEARLRGIEESLARVRHESREPRSRVEAYGGAEEHLVRRGERIRALAARAAGLDAERTRVGQLTQEIRDIERRAGTLAPELFRVPWDEVDRPTLLAVPLSDVRDAARSYRAAREERRAAEEGLRIAGGASGEGLRPPPLPIGAALLVLGAAALLWGLLAGSAAAAAVAALALAAAAALLVRRADLLRAGGEVQRARDRLAAARDAEEAARLRLLAPLEGLPLRDGLRERPDSELVSSLERLQELVRDHEDRGFALRECERRLGALGAELAQVGTELRIELPPGPAAAAHVLQSRLRQAETRNEAAAGARRELERLTRELRRLEEERERLLFQRDELWERVRRLGEGDGERGLRHARARGEALRLARKLREELDRSHPDLEEITAKIRSAEAAGEAWTVDEEALAARRAREEELTDRIEALARRLEALEKDAERIREKETPDQVEGESLALREEVEAAARERDRRWLLARLLREADRRFREEHQPDVIRRAGAHLAAVTGGRYGRILVGEGEQEGTFLLRGPGYPGAVPVGEPISTGTREQAYLALRLAIVDHLDRSGERLPLFMDEALVNWDPARRDRGLDLLGRVAEHRQVFLFTCHPDIVDGVRARGAGVVRLEATG